MTKIRDLMPWNNGSSVFVRKGENFATSLAALQEEMNRLFDHFYSGTQLRLTDWDQKLPAAPAVNVVEDAASFKVDAELAGIDPKNVTVEVTPGYLMLKGERKEEKEEKKEGGNYLRQEISYGAFLRTVSLPESADYNGATATFKNGILTVNIPKKADARQQPKKIDIKTAA